MRWTTPPAGLREQAGRPRRRGVRRVRRGITMDGDVDKRVEQIADLEHGGNYSAALQQLVEQGLAAEHR